MASCWSVSRRGPASAAELAFAALVERHGPMVLRVCRGILRDEHAAMDAFQATFLVLIRKSRWLWVRESLGPWLHRVACRAAVRLERESARRRKLERRLAELTAARTADGDRDELARVLHEEIDRLPEHYRVAIVTCDVEGRTCEEAARLMGCPVGTGQPTGTRTRTTASAARAPGCGTSGGHTRSGAGGGGRR